MLRSTVIALASLTAIVAAESWCQGEEPPTLMTAIAQWQYPGSKINGASLSDAETVNASGQRTAPSVQYKTVLTTKDPLDKVVQYYEAKLKPVSDAKAAGRLGESRPASGRSVTFHNDSENRPVAIHIILVNTGKSSTTLVISRAEKESETHIAWSRYVLF
jgi:hypothetical protein